MYVYMYNIDWIRGWKIRISFFLFKHSMKLSISLVTGEGELLGSLSSVPCTHNCMRLDRRRQANWL